MNKPGKLKQRRVNRWAYLWDVGRDLVRDGLVVAADEQSALVLQRVLHARAERGDRMAEATLGFGELEGLRQELRRFFKAITGEVVTGSGKVIEQLPLWIGVRVKSSNGRTRVVLKPWITCTRDEIEGFISRLIRFRTKLADLIEGYREILMLMDRYPQAATPGEACTLAGVDPLHLKVA